MTQLLNTNDYSTTILTLALIGSVFWVIVYLLLVKDAIKYKYMEMPIIAFCGNIAWEFLYSFVFVDHINLGRLYTWGYQAWFFIDLVIMFFVFRYGKKQIRTQFFKKNFYVIVPVLMLFFGILLYFWISLGFDNTPFDAIPLTGKHISKVALGATSAYFLNLIISLLYLRELFIKVSFKQLSLANGVFRWLGTGLFTIMFHLIDPGNYIVTSLGVFIFLSDSIYVFHLTKHKLRPNLKLNESYFLYNNAIFLEEWSTEMQTETFSNQELKVITKDEWVYERGDFTCIYKLYEGGLIYQKAIGKMSNDDAKIVVPMITKIAEDFGLLDEGYFFMSDSLEVKMAEPEARNMSMDYFKDNAHLKKFIVVVSPMVSTMIRLAPMKGVTKEFVISDSLENAFINYLNLNATSNSQQKNWLRDQTESKDRTILDLIEAISVNKFQSAEAFSLPENDPNHYLINPLKLLAHDREVLLREKNAIESDIKENLEKRINQFTTLFTYSGFYSIIINSDFVVKDYNQKAEELFSKLGQQIELGYNISNFLNNEQFNFLTKQLSDLEYNEQVSYTFKVVLEEKELWLETTVFKIDSEKETLIGFVSNEVSDRVKLSKEKSSLVERLKKKNEYLESVHHTISHELNHEIASINQITTLLNDPMVDIRKKMELIEDLAVISKKLGDIRSKMNSSLTQDKAGQSNTSKTSEQKSACCKITLIDDDPVTNTVNKLTIKSFNDKIPTNTFKNGQKAIEAIKNAPDEFDLIFLDINMPDISGWEVLDEIDAFAFEHDLKIFMLSSSEDDREKEKSQKYKSVHGFVSKPLNKSILSSLLNK